MPSNPKDFQKSITKELDIVRNRVRDLIGSAHWGSDGNFKEAILRNSINKFLPKNVSIGTGFIIQSNEDQIEGVRVSHQLDIIVFDNSLPVLFSEGDFIITTEQNVLGIVEVKTKIINNNGNKSSLKAILEKYNGLSSFPLLSRTDNHRIFKGVFSFEYEDDINGINIENALRVSNGMVNHISLGKDKFIRHWTSPEGLIPQVDCNSTFYNLYNIPDLSFSYFISNLIHIVTRKEMDDRYWFSFPIQESKEINRIKTVCFDPRE
jgi:hypothetical protein